MHAPHVLKIDVEAIIRSTHNETPSPSLLQVFYLGLLMLENWVVEFEAELSSANSVIIASNILKLVWLSWQQVLFYSYFLVCEGGIGQWLHTFVCFEICSRSLDHLVLRTLCWDFTWQYQELERYDEISITASGGGIEHIKPVLDHLKNGR